MSTRRGIGGRTELSETLQEFLVGAARFVFYLGLVAAAVAIGLVVFTYVKVNGGSGVNLKDAAQNIETFGKILNGAVVAIAIGSSVLFWGEELFSAGLLGLAALLGFAPIYVPMVLGESKGPESGSALQALQTSGMILGAFAVVVTVIDVAGRVQNRIKHGTKADQLKYGKGIKEEADKQNILLGKCWQLPFCRKFVREKCPIYHAKTSCWKHMVGCMCEELVIRSAMEDKPIPKGQLLTATYIPQNNKLTTAQKRERCHQCVIYNEHQRHKYKVAMPVAVGSFGLVYLLFHGPLYHTIEGMCIQLNKVVKAGTLGSAQTITPPMPFVEMLLAAVMIIGLTYTMKTLETLIFKLKV